MLLPIRPPTAYAYTVRGKGSGPKTAGGKAASSRNSIKHGLRSGAPVVPGESHDDWQRHLDGIMQSLQPQNYLEEQLAGLIALGLWRRWRIERYEVEVTTAHMASTEEDL